MNMPRRTPFDLMLLCSTAIHAAVAVMGVEIAAPKFEAFRTWNPRTREFSETRVYRNGVLIWTGPSDECEISPTIR
jgi:hypothetical protein